MAALQNFTDKVTKVTSAWLNMVDVLATTVFGQAANQSQARTSLFSDAPLELTNGGTGQRSFAPNLFLGTDPLGNIITTALPPPPTPPVTYPRTPQEITANVTPTNLAYPPGSPERYYIGTFSYASDTTGLTGTDFTAAIAVALSVTGQPCTLGPHNYLFSNIVVPNQQTLLGVNHRLSNLISKSGSTGTVLTDGGSGAGMVLQNFAIYCNFGPGSAGNNTNYSAGVVLGYNGIQFGTEALIDGVWIRDLPAGFPGLDINGNIWEGGFICVQSTGGVRFVGSGAFVTKLELVANLGFPSSRTATQVAAQFSSDTWIGATESEAWASNVAAMEIDALCSISHAVFAFNNSGWTGDHVIQITGNATSWVFNNIVGYSNIANLPVIGSGWIKLLTSSTYFGGTTTHSAEGFNSSTINTLGGVTMKNFLQVGSTQGQFQSGSIYQGSGAPSAAAGNAGDVYFRTDTPSTVNQRIYMKIGAVWTGIV